MGVQELARTELPEQVTCELVGVDIDPSLIDLAMSSHGAAGSDRKFYAVDFLDAAAVEQLREKVSVNGDSHVFNLITVFSTTMWIHINHGDEGLRKFFEHVASFLLPSPWGGLLVEPQPTKCYRTAVKRCRKLGLPQPRSYQQIRPESAEKTVQGIVEDIRPFKQAHCLGLEGWGRTLTLFCEPSIVLSSPTEELTSSKS